LAIRFKGYEVKERKKIKRQASNLKGGYLFSFFVALPFALTTNEKLLNPPP
jgi:hypothetical protein